MFNIEKFLKKEKSRFRSSIDLFLNFYKSFIDVYDEDLSEIKLKNILRKYIQESHENETYLGQIAEEIIGATSNNPQPSIFERLYSKENEIISHIVQKYLVCAAVAAHWELQIKFFAGKTNIKIYRDNNSGEHIETIYLSNIIRGIKTKFPYLSMDLETPLSIRNSLIHGNLHQLKTTIPMTHENESDLDSKMFVLKMNTADGKNIFNANDPLSKDQAKEMGPFFWFLSQGNTKLLHFAGNILEKSINEIRTLSFFHAYSFGSSAGFFEQVAIKGKILSDQQAEVFKSELKKHLGTKEDTQVEREYKRMTDLFNLKT